MPASPAKTRTRACTPSSTSANRSSGIAEQRTVGGRRSRAGQPPAGQPPLLAVGQTRSPADDDWLEAFGLRELLPDALAAWRPLVADALAFFLGQLPEHRSGEIVVAQLALGEDASVAHRLVALLAQCPTLHKLGQLVARNRHLPAELRSHLQQLESMPSSLPVASIVARIHAEIGHDAGLELADAPLAEASVAVVLPFSWREDGITRHGVFKVLKPGVEQRLDEELAVLPALAGFLRRRGAELGLSPLDYDDYLASVRRLLEREVRLENEQARLRQAAEFYADEPRVLVPRLLRWSTPRVTAMERVFGKPVTEAPLAPWQRRRLASVMVSALLARPFFTDEEEALFHGDLHGGNLFATDDGRLAVLDWGLTASVSKSEREALVAMALAALCLDAAKLRSALASLVGFEPDESLVAATVERALDRLVEQGRPAGFDWLIGMLDEFALASPVPLPADLALLRKTWLSLSGVIADLAPELSADLPLLDVGARRFFAELPARAIAWPLSREFSTHVSNADLVAASRSCGFAWLRYWARLAGIASRASPKMELEEAGTA